MKDELKAEVMRPDEELAEAMKEMSPDEQVAYFKSFYQMIMDDPEMAASLPPETIEGLKQMISDFEQATAASKRANRNLEIAMQNKAIAQGRFDRTVDQLLRTWEPDGDH